MHAESDCRGFDADADIVLLVLMRVDRVIADGPKDAAEYSSSGGQASAPVTAVQPISAPQLKLRPRNTCGQ